MDMPIIDQVLISLRQIIRSIDLHSRKLIRDYGMTVPQLVLLREVNNQAPITVGELARATQLSQGTVTQIITRLEQRGLVLRRKDEKDKRKVRVMITDQGAAVLSDSPPLIHDRFVRSFRQLKGWEQALLLSSLERIAEMMGVDGLEAAPLLSGGALHSNEASPDEGVRKSEIHQNEDTLNQ